MKSITVNIKLCVFLKIPYINIIHTIHTNKAHSLHFKGPIGIRPASQIPKELPTILLVDIMDYNQLPLGFNILLVDLKDFSQLPLGFNILLVGMNAYCQLPLGSNILLMGMKAYCQLPLTSNILPTSRLTSLNT